MPTTTNYIWDEDNYLAESDGNNTINVVYTNEPQRCGNLISSRISGTTSYHEFDALGSTRQLTNSAGATTDSAIYDAWGNVVARTGTTATAQLWIGEIGYYSDSETALAWVRRRSYAAAVGRWQAPDPAGLEAALVLYLYARNAPNQISDPSGAFPPPVGAPTGGPPSSPPSGGGAPGGPPAPPPSGGGAPTGLPPFPSFPPVPVGVGPYAILCADCLTAMTQPFPNGGGFRGMFGHGQNGRVCMPTFRCNPSPNGCNNGPVDVSPADAAGGIEVCLNCFFKPMANFESFIQKRLDQECSRGPAVPQMLDNCFQCVKDAKAAFTVYCKQFPKLNVSRCIMCGVGFTCFGVCDALPQSKISPPYNRKGLRTCACDSIGLTNPTTAAGCNPTAPGFPNVK
jgi:RHS repeat-associated protein